MKSKATKARFYPKKGKKKRKKKGVLSKKQKSAIKRLIKQHPETKCKVLSTSLAGTTTGVTSWSALTLNALVQGTDIDERVGNLVEPIGIRFRFYIDLGDYHKVTLRLLFYYTLNDARTDDLPTSALVNCEPDIFMVLKDKHVTQKVWQDNAGNNLVDYKVWDMWLKPRRGKWVYQDSSSDPENYDRVCFGVKAINAQGTYTDTDCTVYFTAYVYYKDA